MPKSDLAKVMSYSYIAFNANQSKWPYGDYWAKESNLNKVKEVAPELLALMSANEESIVIFVDGINQLYIVSKTTGKWIKFTK